LVFDPLFALMFLGLLAGILYGIVVEKSLGKGILYGLLLCIALPMIFVAFLFAIFSLYTLVPPILLIAGIAIVLALIASRKRGAKSPPATIEAGSQR